MGVINGAKLRAAMAEKNYLSPKLANIINQKYPEANIKPHDINNIINGDFKEITAKIRRKLEIIAAALNIPVDTFLSIEFARRTQNQQPQFLQADNPIYDGVIYREASVIVERMLVSRGVAPSLSIIQEYTKETHDYAVKEGISDPAMLKIYADGTIQGAIRAGILIPSTDLK